MNDPIVCPRCGRMELLIDGIGEELRPPARHLVNRALLLEAAERWETPLYVTDLDRASANASAGPMRFPAPSSPMP